MVREEKQLRSLRNFSQYLQCCLGTSVIKVDEDIVENEW